MGKTLNELTLLDKFLFDQAMDDPQAHEAMLQIIFGTDQLRLLSPAQTEKELRTAPWLRSIRVDVFAMDDVGQIYDTEMQAKYRNDLAKRSRYYQALIDTSLLEPGAVSFNDLNNVFVIMITPFDLFGKGKYRYTFVPCCREDKSLELADGGVRIFLNTRGTNDDEVDPELVAFLHYVETMDEAYAASPGNEHIRRIHECVSRIKSSEEIGVKYMQAWEEKIIERQEGREEGKAEGMAEAVLDLLGETGDIPDTLKDLIMSQKDIDILKKWHKMAARVKDVESFRREIGV